MKLEIQLVKDGSVVFSLPVAPGDEPTEEDLSKLSKIYSIASNERRLRLMSELSRNGEMTFSDLLEVAINPKYVHDCMSSLEEEGMVIHKARSGYAPSAEGTAVVFAITQGMPRIWAAMVEALEEEEIE